MGEAVSRKIVQLIDLATERAGGLRALGSALGWHYTGICRVKAGERISAYRAAQIYEYLGESPRLGVAVAFDEQSRTDDERDYWRALLKDTFDQATIADKKLLRQEN